MQCIRCGAEINEGMAFCPTCGAAQNAAQNIEDGRIYNIPQSQQHWQPNEQSPQLQYQQQQPYGQQLYQQPIQQQQGWTQNNVQGMTDMQKKKSSKKPLIISLVVAIIIIIGLTATCIVLIISKDSSSKGSSNSGDAGNSGSLASTPEKTVERFLDTLLDWDFSEAVDEYLHPAYISYLGGRYKAIEEWEDIGMEISSYDDISSKKLSSSEINSLNNELKKSDYDYKITEGSFVKVHIKGPGIGSDDYYVTFIVGDFDGGWYILDWDD